MIFTNSFELQNWVDSLTACGCMIISNAKLTLYSYENLL